MDPNTLVERGTGLIESEVDGELFALHIDRGTCYGFNATATRIWNLIETPRTLDEVCATLRSVHDVDGETCLKEVCALVTMLSAEGLVVLSSRP